MYLLSRAQDLGLKAVLPGIAARQDQSQKDWYTGYYAPSCRELDKIVEGTESRVMKQGFFARQFAICFVALAWSASAELGDLHWRYSGVTNNLRAVTRSDGTIVAAGDAGTIISSTDTIFWNVRTSGTSVDLSGVAYGNGMFVAVGGTTNAEILTSPDAVTWTRQTTSFTNSLKAVAFGTNVFVAVGVQGAILVSTNGVSWSKRPTGLNKTFRAVTSALVYLPGRMVPLFVAVGDEGSMFTSWDGLAWGVQNSSVLLDLYCVGGAAPHRGDQPAVVAAGAEGVAISSADGSTWTPFTIPTSEDVYAAAAGGVMGNGGVSIFGLAGNAGAYVYRGSVDTSVWRTQASNTGNTLRGMVQRNGQFIVVGDHGTVRCGRIFLRRNSPVLADFNGVTWGKGRYVAAGSGGTLASSLDGITWSSTVVSTQNFLSVSYGANRFVAVGEGLSVAVSQDGLNWTNEFLPTPPDFDGSQRKLHKVAYGNGAFIASGYYGIQAPYPQTPCRDLVLLSTNGIDWQRQTNLPRGLNNGYYLMGSAGPKVFLMAGDDLSTSTDGSNWVTRVQGTGVSYDPFYSQVAYGPEGFLALAAATVIPLIPSLALSNDATNWTVVQATEMVPATALAYGNGSYVAVGGAGTDACFAESTNRTKWILSVFSLPDGPYPLTVFLRGVAAGDGSFVVVGDKGWIMQSVPDVLPARLRAMPGDQSIVLEIISEPGRPLAIQSSTNLVTWNTQTSLTPSEDVTRLSFPTTSAPMNYFRAVSQP
jgi:hypothetical protein